MHKLQQAMTLLLHSSFNLAFHYFPPFNQKLDYKPEFFYERIVNELQSL